MTIKNIGNFKADKNLTELAQNVDYNRLGSQDFYITVNYGTTPATVTVKAGSIFECNGNRYEATIDEPFQMSNASHNYLTFTDNPVKSFGSTDERGAFSIGKNGYYLSDNKTRVLDMYIDQSGEVSLNLLDSLPFFNTPFVEGYDRVRVNLSADIPGPFTGVLPFDIKAFDIQNNFDAITNYRFTAIESGYYHITALVTINSDISETMYIRRNGANYAELMASYRVFNVSFNAQCFIFLNTTEYIDVYATVPAATPLADIYSAVEKTFFCIERIL